MDRTQLLMLAQKYLEGTASEEETRLLHEWYDAAGEEEIEMVFTNQPETEPDISQRIFAGLHEKIHGQTITAKVRQMHRIKWVAAASIIFVLLVTGGYLLTRRTTPQKPAIVQNTTTPPKIQDVQPGGDKARLTLADGTVIVLTDIKDGEIRKEQGISITKQNGQLIYDASHAQMTAGSEGPTHHSLLTTHHTITTPRGGQYQVILPDGTKVWLNASSSLQYPAAFTGNERKVTLTGEGYFEVTKNAGKSFKVHIISGDRNSEVEVLGTHFNINAYDDEADVKTTLLEGKVKVSAISPVLSREQSAVLKPGEQISISQTSQLSQPFPVQTDAVIAWKNGLFSFNSMDIQTIMRQIARWYNLDVSYEGKIPATTFTWEESRNTNLSVVLKVLETGGVHFRLEGNTQPGQPPKIVVLP
jgi:transmembrane sensor